MREIINPYQPDQIPASKEAFFGREELVIWLEQQFIARRRVLILRGPKQIGKTTFLHFLPEMLTSKKIVVTFFWSKLANISLNSLLLFTLQTLTEQVVQQGLLAPDKIVTAADLVSGLNHILSQIQEKSPETNVLFLIDDFDHILELDPREAALFLDVCQVLLAAQPQLQFILTASDTALSHFAHPILDTAPSRQITPLSPNAALYLITRPVEGVIRFDYGVSKRIAELNSNHPYYLTLFNYVLFNRYAREGWVNLRYLDDALHEVLRMEIPAFEGIWSGATWIERAVLMVMASVKGARGVFNQQEIVPLFRRHNKEADEKVIITALEALTFQGVLVKMGALSYRFYVDLFRHWLQEHFDLETVLKEVIWKEPTARPQVVAPAKTEEEVETAPRPQMTILKWPAWLTGTSPWVIGLIGVIVAGVLIIGLISLSNILSISDEPSAPNLTPTNEVVKFQVRPLAGEVSTLSPPTVTPTPAPTPTPTPTPPIVVARTLPSIAYMARQGDNPWQIQLMNIDGSEIFSLPGLQIRPLVGLADETSPVWSPQGDKLAFVSQQDGNREIYIMDVDGENLVNFTQHPADDWTPAWSPDGAKIAFSSNRYGHWEIFWANLDGSDLQQVTNTGDGNISPVWSPDGQSIAFSSKRDGNWEIYTMRVDGTELRRLTDNAANDLAPIWSPSGDLIAYETNVDGDVEIYVMNKTGGNLRNVSKLSYANDHGPVWSPNDQRLMFYSNREGNWDLFSVNLDGTNAVNLTNTPDIDEQTPAWRP